MASSFLLRASIYATSSHAAPKFGYPGLASTREQCSAHNSAAGLDVMDLATASMAEAIVSSRTDRYPPSPGWPSLRMPCGESRMP